MLTLKANDKKKFNPWALPMWFLEHPFWGWLAIVVMVGMVSFALLVATNATFFAVVFMLSVLVFFIMLITGTFIWLVEGGFDDIYRYVENKYEASKHPED